MTKIIGSGGGGGGKGGGGGGRTPTTDKDSLDSKSYANVLDLISEGEIEGLKDGLKSVYLNNTPIQNSDNSYNFDNVSYAFREGASDQTKINGFDNAATTVSVNRQVTKGTGGWVAEKAFPLNSYITRTVSETLRYFQATTAGTSGTSEPSWNTSVGGTTSDGGVVWTCIANDPNVGETETVATSDSVDVIRVILKIPQLQEIEDDGDIKGTSVRIKIQMSVDGGGFTDKITDKIKGRTGDLYKRDYEITLPATFSTDVKIRVIRLTANAGSEGTADGTRLSNQTWWDSYVRITYTDNTYPNSALAGLRIDAEQFSSVPQRAYLIRGTKIRIPSNATVDSATGALIYSGTWNGTFQAATWCSDPAWCLWDLLTSQRYGLGDHILTASEKASFNGNAERLSKFDFYAASQYCSANNTRPTNPNNDYGANGKHGIADGFGGFEPRFSCNVYIQGRAEAFDLINSMSAIFMAMPYWSVGSLALTQDKPGSSSYLFTLANITSEGFNYSGSSQRSRATAVVVKYFDQTLRAFAYEEVEDDASLFNGIAKYGVITKNIEAFACTSRGQARRVGRWLIYSEAQETEVVSFTCSLEAGVLVRPGQIIDVADPLKAGLRRGGRIAAATTSQITVDGEAGVDTDLPQGLTADLGYTRTIHVLLSDGTVESRPVSSIAGNVIVPDTVFSSAPNVNSVWVLETTGGTSAQNLQTTQWRVVAVEEVDDLEYKVSALAYNSSKYGNVESGFSLTQRDFSNLNEIPSAPPAPLTVIQQLYKQADQVKAKIVFSWQSVLGVSKYEVRWRKDGGNWNTYMKIGTSDDINDITAGTFEFKIFSLNATGVASTSALTGSFSASGKTRNPSNITNFAYLLDPTLGFVLQWDKLISVYPHFDDLDVVGYEIRTTNANFGLANNDYYNPTTPVAGENLIARVTANSYNLGFIATGSQGYWIKAYDSQEKYSTTASSISISISAPVAPTASIIFEGNNVVISWNQVSTTGRYAISHYEVSKSSTFATVLEKLDTTVYKREVDWTGTGTFYLRSVDIAGNTSTGTVLTLANVGAQNYGLAVNYNSGTSAELTWTDKDGSTPTVAYELAHSATTVTSFSSATGNQQVKGTTFSYVVNWNINKRFWIRALNGQGLSGAEEYVDINFTLPSVVPNFTAGFKGIGGNALLKSELELTWGSATRGSLNIDEYEVRKGATFASASVIATIKGLSTTTQVDWNGTQKFWVVAKDINGNYGTELSQEATVTPPAKVGSFVQEVIDNNVLLNWTEAESILPILYYNIKKGSSYASGSTIGTKQGLFTTVFETVSGTFTYWIAAIDSANNVGTPEQVSATVNQPPDYVLRKNVDSTFASQASVPTTVTSSNAFIDAGNLFVNVDTTRTYQDHFIGTGSAGSPQFPNWNSYGATALYGLPSATSGFYQEILDYGTTLAGTKIVQTLTGTHEEGSTSITPTISISTDDTSYTDYAGSATTDSSNTHSAFGTSFRYVKFRYDFSSAGNDDLLKISAFNMRLETKQKTDSGSGTASASDSGGTTVNFSTTTGGGTYFVDVISITVTPKGTVSTGALVAIYDFTDAPNPTSFKVLLYNTSGTRVSGDFSWTARGN